MGLWVTFNSKLQMFTRGYLWNMHHGDCVHDARGDRSWNSGCLIPQLFMYLFSRIIVRLSQIPCCVIWDSIGTPLGPHWDPISSKSLVRFYSKNVAVAETLPRKWWRCWVSARSSIFDRSSGGFVWITWGVNMKRSPIQYHGLYIYIYIYMQI